MVLTKFDYDPLLDLAPWVGQRQATFRFERFNGVTGEELGEIHPIRSAALTHDTTRTIKRSLTLPLGATDTAAMNPVQDRIRPFMVFPNGTEYQLGVYMFSDASREVFTAGKLGTYTLNDEMFRVDQPLTVGYINNETNDTMGIPKVVEQILTPVGITLSIAPSPYGSNDSWSIGTTRGSILESLALTGDYFSPWFDNTGIMRWIRVFDPAMEIPDFDFDAGNKVFRDRVIESDNLLTAPNRFVVVSNRPDDSSSAVVGEYDIPTQFPHSIANRGFVIADVQDLPVRDNVQAAAAARNIGIRGSVYEQVSLTTAPDPRHDSYNVIWWQGAAWLELGWSLAMTEGGAMNHLLRKAYRL